MVFAIIWGLIGLVSAARSTVEYRKGEWGQGTISAVFSVLTVALSVLEAASA